MSTRVKLLGVLVATALTQVAAGLPREALAADLTSASYTLRFAHSAAVGPGRLSAPPAATIGSSGVSVGQGAAVGPSGTGTTLASHFSGFWALQAGGFPTLDLDGDGIAFFLDDDDDGDGLLDVAETDTGIFNSTSDAGTNRLDSDTDDDGFDDLAEAVAGSDPNDGGSFPMNVPLPAAVLAVVVVSVLISGRRLLDKELRGAA